MKHFLIRLSSLVFIFSFAFLIAKPAYASSIVDTFTNTPETLLEKHVSDSGNMWTENKAYIAGQGVISDAERLRSKLAGLSIYMSNWVPASPDYEVSADIYIANKPISANTGVGGRAGNTSFTGYYALITPTAPTVKLYRGGNATPIGSYNATITAGQTYNLKLRMQGSNIKVLLDDAEIINTNPTGVNLILTAGQASMYIVGASTNTTQAHIDNFKAETLPLVSGALNEVKHTNSTVTLSFTPSTGGTSPLKRQLQRNVEGTDTWVDVNGITTSPFTDTGLLNSTTYNYRLVTTDGISETVSSNVVTVTTNSLMSVANLWMKADSLVGINDGGVVTTWKDSSISGLNLTQTVATAKPTYRANVLKGNPVIRFDGNDFLNSISTPGSLKLTTFIVVKSNTTKASYFLTLGNNLNAILHGSLSGSWEYYNTPRTKIANISNSSFQIVTSRVGKSVTGAFTLGAYYGGASPWSGEVAEILVFKSALSDSDYNTVYDYLFNKYFTPSVPEAPQITKATAGNSKATIEFTPPVMNGGFEVTNYTLTSFPEGLTASGTSSPIVITGLTNEKTYTFSITATNELGESNASAISNPVIPYIHGQAGTPTLTGVNKQVLLSWRAPQNVAVTDYIIEYKHYSSDSWVIFADGASPKTKAIVTGLTNNEDYNFRVTAVYGGVRGIPSPITTAKPVEVQTLGFVFTGESNSGGVVNNTFANAQELAPRSEVKILNNESFQFEDLDIGTNNTIDHDSFPRSTTHGLELHLANLVKTNIFPDNPSIYLIKTGHGGSQLHQWNVGGTYWTKFQERINVAKSQLQTPTQWVVWYSLGINDANLNTPVATFKTLTLEHINKIKAELPGAIIVMTQFQSMGSRYAAYNTVMAEFAASEPNVLVVDSTGATLGDAFHWNYAGYKTMSARMVDITKNALGLIYPSKPLAVTPTIKGVGEVELLWTTPLTNGGFPITDYYLEYKKDSESAWTVFNDGVSTATTKLIPALQEGATYNFRVSAISSKGRGNASLMSEPITIPVAQPPTQVQNLVVTGVNKQALLSWTIPFSDKPITDYLIEYKLADGETWNIFDDGVSPNTKSVVINLVNGQIYDFRISGVSTVGSSVTSSTVQASPKEISSLTFVITGESNSGGMAKNSNATAQELAPTPEVKILNNSTFLFENLDIGTNNNIDHYNLAPTTMHGLELGLANLIKAHAFPNRPSVHLIKTGQGSSRIDQWNVGGTYWTKFLQRMNAARTQLDPNTQFVVWYSLGINDFIAGTPTTTFKNGTIDHLNKIKAELPGAIIIMTQFQSMTANAGYPAYNKVLAEIAATESNVFVVDTSGVTLTDWNHWSYAGYKTIASRMVDITKNNLGLIYPGQPGELELVEVGEEVTLSWTAPLSNGGSQITDYIVEYKLDTDPNWIVFEDGISTATTSVIAPNLIENSTYQFRIAAINTKGKGSPSNVVTLNTGESIE